MAQALPRQANLVSLPEGVRRRIYYLAGLVHGETIFIYKDQYHARSNSDVTRARLTVDLLLVSKLINAEVNKIVYAENRMSFAPREYVDISLLYNFSRETISYMKTISFELDVSSCKRSLPSGLILSSDATRAEKYSESVEEIDDGGHAVLTEWDRVLRYFLAHVAPGQLDLSLICNTENPDASVLALKPLEVTTQLKGCQIRLGTHKNPRLQDKAREVALSSTGMQPDKTNEPFRYLNLPLEVRNKILEYTDLVSPLNEVNWDPQNGYFLEYWIDSESMKLTEDRRACLFRECMSRSPHGWFCMRFCSAYNQDCHCWAPPKPLFLVCRDMHSDAEAVFFRCNRFVVRPIGSCVEPYTVISKRLEASTFLTKIMSSSASRHLRDLEIVIPPFEGQCLPENGEAHSDWKEVLDSTKAILSLPNLTLRIYFCDYDDNGYKVTAFRAEMTKESAQDMYQTYNRFLTPLVEYWKNLKHLYVYFAHPLRWTRSFRRNEFSQPGFRELHTQKLERFCELDCIGPESERLREGRDGKPPSQWFKRVELSAQESQGSRNPLLYYP